MTHWSKYPWWNYPPEESAKYACASEALVESARAVEHPSPRVNELLSLADKLTEHAEQLGADSTLQPGTGTGQ